MSVLSAERGGKTSERIAQARGDAKGAKRRERHTPQAADHVHVVAHLDRVVVCVQVAEFHSLAGGVEAGDGVVRRLERNPVSQSQSDPAVNASKIKKTVAANLPSPRRRQHRRRTAAGTRRQCRRRGR